MLELITGRGIVSLRSSDAFIYLFRGFTIVGTNPPKDTGPLYYIWSAFLNGSMIMVLPIACSAGFVLKYVHHTIGTMQFLSGLQAGLNAVGIPPKIIIVALSMKRLRSVESILASMDARYTKPEDVDLIRRAAIMGNRLVFAFGFAYMTYMSITVVPRLIVGMVPFSMWIPFLDDSRSRTEFFVQSALDMFLVIFPLLHQCLNDSYGSVYICVIRAHLQLLIRRVKLLGADADKSSDDKMQELVDCIVTHQQILRLVAVIAPIISKTMFTQFLILASILCVTMINLFIFADLSTQIASAVYFICVMLQTSPCCYLASELMEESEKLPYAIFHSNWVEQDRRFRKVIIYFIQRTQVPIQLNAMNLFTIDVATNASIAKFSFTLFTFIRAMGVGERNK